MPSVRLRTLSAAEAVGLAMATIATAACSQSPAAPAPAASVKACNYLVSPTTVGVGLNGGTFMVSVNADAGSTCAWTASTADEWIHVAGPTTGQGTGALQLTISTPSPLRRHGTVAVSWDGGAASISVDQGCASPATQTVNLNAESQIYLTSNPCTFNGRAIEIDVPWLHFISTYGGGFQIGVSVALNTGPERTGHITTAIGVITIVQAPGNCVTALTPASQAFDANGGSGSFTVTALPGCPWEATPHDNGSYKLPWSHGSGNGEVTFTMPLNRGPDILSWYYIVGGTSRFEITESGCGGLTVSPLNLRVPAALGDFSVAVTGGSLCAWSDASNDAFIMRPREDRTGPGTVEFRVGLNDTGKIRSGSLSVARQTVTVTQDP